MPAVGVVTLLLVLLFVGLAAEYLIRVGLALKNVNEALDTVVDAVRAIEAATQPITPILGSMTGDLAATQKALEDLLAAKAAPVRSKPVMVSHLRQRGA